MASGPIFFINCARRAAYSAGQEGAKKIFKANEAYPIHEFEKKLPELLENRHEIHYTLGLNKSFDKVILKAVNKIRNKIRSGVQSPIVFVDVVQTVHEMRLIKSPAEIALMRKAADISAEAHERAVERMIQAGARPMTSLQYLLELQRDWARAETYDLTTGIARKWGGAYGLGISYAKTMFGASEGGH